jgi:hypothetical protein
MLAKDEFNAHVKVGARSKRTKASRPERRHMPLLQDGQNPDDLAALVAYHLHRLGIPPVKLMRAGISRDDAREMHAGSIRLTTKDLMHIAAALQLDANDLCRELGDDEKRQWRFYRVSARQVAEVWRRVAETAAAHGCSQHRLGELLGISQSAVSRVIRGERTSPVLNWHDAATIAAALGLKEGPDVFLARCLDEENP